jgi:two-component system, LytTR family, sensor kinase
MPFSKFAQVIFHIVGWLLFFTLMIAFTYHAPVGEKVVHEIFSSSYLVFYVTYLSIFYANTNFLMPRLYFGKQHFLYFTFLIVLLIVVYFSSPFDHLMRLNNPPGPPPGNGTRRGPRFDIISILLFVMTWSLSSAISIVKEWRYTLQKMSQAEAEKARAELAFLKAQINPHFLFNTLNNIYSLALTKKDDTPFAIMKLSNIMRYLTDDATHDYVALQSEVACISDYIELQRLRLNQKTEINFSVSGQLDEKQISPLILITFVENVFKYGVSNHEPSPLTIKISADERTITLFCQNRVFNTLRKADREGIGINNTKQRLQLLYPKKHLLNVTTEKGVYTVLLTMQL